jgi:hypothetical protein
LSLLRSTKAVYSVTLCIAYTRSVKKSVGRVVKTGVVNLSLRPPRCSDEARDNKGENDTQHRVGEGENGTLVAVCLRQDIACSEIKEEATGSPPENIDCARDHYPDDYE